MDMDGNQNHRNPKSSILKPVPKSFPVVRFTLTNFFYLFKVITNKTKRYSAEGKLFVLVNEFVQFMLEECPPPFNLGLLQCFLVGFL